MPTSKSPRGATAHKAQASHTSKAHSTRQARSDSHAHQASRPDAHADTHHEPDAIELLTDDHKEVKQLFKDYEKLVKDGAESALKQDLAQRICLMLKVHTSIEEDIFYPAAREVLKDHALLNEAEVEHASAKELITQIETMSADDEMYDAKVTVLGEYIDHHVKEEEKEMFPQLKQTKMDIDLLGHEMLAHKDALLTEAGVPPIH